jgi:hypothetical protein
MLITTFGEQIFYTVTGINQKHREILKLMSIDMSVYAQVGAIQNMST